MTTTEIEDYLKNFIEEWYNCKFTGQIKLEIPYSNTYYVKLLLNNKNRPMQITYQGEFEDFCKFITDELRRRRFTDTEYYIGYKNVKPEIIDLPSSKGSVINFGFPYIFNFKLS